MLNTIRLPSSTSWDLGDPQCISAATGGGTGDLLDIIVDKLQDNPEESYRGGYSSFRRGRYVLTPVRAVSSMPSSVRIATSLPRLPVLPVTVSIPDYDKFGFDFYLVDTAGIRTKNKVSEDLEFYSVMRSIRAIENSDVCILMLDATRGIETQDMNIFQLIQKNNKSLVVVVNKWDLVEEKNQKVIDTFENAIRNRMAPFVDFPIIFASALDQAAYLPCTGDSQGGLPEPQGSYRYFQAQRGDVAYHRGLSTTEREG